MDRHRDSHKRTDGLIGVGLGLALAALGPQKSSQLKAEMAADAATKEREARTAAMNEAALAASRPVHLTKQQMLANMSAYCGRRMDSAASWIARGAVMRTHLCIRSLQFRRRGRPLIAPSHLTIQVEN
jgi:hypothetical protein